MAREAALKILYQLDVRSDLEPAELFSEIDAATENEDARRFARDLVLGARAELATIDAELAAVAHNWTLTRMAAIDRNVLRLGAFELLFREDLPAAVSINEAVELAKNYSTQDSGAFVNGILDKIRVRASAPDRAAPSGN
ncbi:MAG: transcription antitermination factor NusB [Planctomycetes bacterium]|nr:transcription antitermination factor NusB [Planctomycetota bacterium]